ncbi:hypothetical protein [Oceanidesulfovibrio indonesiensis]|uniref:hypothetical protein n=1 Tax=Oceanidesulfovibrio indonesiensis TaxID=54767 RepID=UPI00142F9B0B|nr:hypothetical protein [Oceanidesulfovibrio indonesiensis]
MNNAPIMALSGSTCSEKILDIINRYANISFVSLVRHGCGFRLRHYIPERKYRIIIRFNHMPDVSARVCANARAASIEAGRAAGNPHHGHYNVFTTLRPTGI